MSLLPLKRTRLFAVALLMAVSSFLAIPVGAATPNGVTLNTHQVLVDGSNKIVPWTTVEDQAYAQVSASAWNYLINSVPTHNGKPAYYTQSYLDPNTQQVANWPHNPAGLYSMLIESAIEYYQYSGDARVLDIAKNVANYQLANGMTKPTDNWASVPYASANAGSLTYNGSNQLSGGAGDGIGVIETDKVAEFGHGLVQLYKLTGDQTYLDAAVQNANQLVSHVRVGNSTQSPWGYRVVAATGAINEQYTSHVSSALELFDDLIALNVGNVSGYQSTRSTVWNWVLAYPMVNNYWSGYFEDVATKANPNDNLNQLNAMMMARYLLQNPDKDPNWESHTRGLIAWVEQQFGTNQYGATTIKEQNAFAHAMGSHTSRYASVNALLYEKTGDTAAREKAYRSFNWATYMARTNGVVIDGPTVNNQWFTDGYGDYVRHFMVGMGAVPAFAPSGQTHLLETTSLVQTITYGTNTVSYQTFDTTGTEEVKVDRQPSGVTLGGAPLAQRTDLAAEGWVYSATDSTVKIRRDNGRNVVLTLSGSPANQAPSVSLTAPANGATYQAPASFQLAATASDPEGALSKVEFYQNGTLLGTSTTSPYVYNIQNLAAGSYTFTARAYDDQNATTTSSPVAVTVGSTQTSTWTDIDVGSVGVAGSASVSGGIYTVKGSGVDIWGTADSFNFDYVTMTGDGEIKARVATQQNTDQWALAGIMMRENLTAGSRHALAAVTPTNGLSFDYRSAANGVTNYINGGSGTAPYWLRITRVGNVFTTYKSTNGTTWTSMGNVTLALGSTIYVGLAVTSHNNSTLGTATFDNVFVSGQSTGGDTTAPVISNVASGSANLNGATITWTTNEPASSQVEYGTTTAYGSSTPLNSSLDTSHTQVVSGLQAGTTYHYRVKSTDAAGNQATSADFTFTTQSAPDTTPPSAPTGVSATALSTTSARIGWTAATDNVGVTGYTIYRNGAVVGTTAALTFTDSSLSAGTTYSYTVTASDAAGNVSAQSAAASVSTPSPDTTAPIVSINAPTNGSTVSGTITLGATASDNVGVAGVQFRLNGANLGSEDTTSPYQTSWNTTSVTNGTYTITAVARDAAGNTTTSTGVTVTVNNAALAGPIAAYNFNEGTGTTLTDRAGTHNGTISGATWSAAGKYAGALSFNGTNNMVTIADAADLRLTNAVTIEAWIKPTSVSGWRTVLMKETTGGLAYSLYAANSASKAAFYGRFGSSEVPVNGTTNVSTSAWTHVSGTYDGSTLRIYTNGTLTASKAQAGAFATSNGTLRIGGNSIWGEYYSGLIDDIRIYSRVLTQAEIQTDMNTAI